MLFYYSDNQTIYFYRESEIVEQVWWDHTRIMSDISFMNELSQFLDYINRFRPKYVILNLQKMFHHVRPDLIPFISAKFRNTEYSGIKKISIIESDDSVTRNLMNEIIKESKLNKCHVEIFKQEEKAIEWFHDPLEEEVESRIFQVA